jgi:hypothetical protein
VTAKVTDGGRDPEQLVDEMVDLAEQQAEFQRRQSELTEDLVEELAYQNAALTEVARALYIVAQSAHDKPSEPPSVPTPTSIRTYIEDHQYTRQEGDR